MLVKGTTVKSAELIISRELVQFMVKNAKECTHFEIGVQK